jgi:peptide/nickel transport system ATP-binding protein
MRVGTILREPLAIQGIGTRSEQHKRTEELLDEVGLSRSALDRFPHEFSGGQRQRIGLARALALNPRLIVADEPVSALDVSVQAQILNLMRKLQRQYELSYLFISHDLSVVRYMSDTIGVMYAGKLVEVGAAEDICTAPAHPYTVGLIDAVPAVTGEPIASSAVAARLPESAGANGGSAAAAADPAEPLTGCRFRSRCAVAAGLCVEQEPPLRPVLATGQLVACHFPVNPAAPDRPSGQSIPSIA